MEEALSAAGGAIAAEAPAAPVEDLGRRRGHRGLLPLVAALGKRLRPVLDFALPPRCPGCGAVVDGDGRFCLGCWEALDWLAASGCAGCGLPIDDLGDGARCATCLATPPAFDGVRAAVLYSPISARIALRLKYGRKPGLAAVMARPLVRHVDVACAPLIVPVPLHRWRLWSRGFNQSALIAREIARATGVDVNARLLERAKPTPVLRGLGAVARREALRGVFRVRPEGRSALKGREVLLIDDVCTSGATAEGCARALKRAGAARVTVLCWARVPPGDMAGARL